MSSIYVLFWFDVEDYVTPESDEALEGLLRIFAARQAQATWKLVGEKARTLEARGRHDILRLLQSQDIGYHTDTHSQHPVLAEYLRDLGWEAGVAEVRRREGPGHADLVRLCGPASTFGQAGGSWGPQLDPVLRELGIPLFMDEASHVGLDGGPFWYGGVLHINRLGDNCTRMPFKRGQQGLEEGTAAFDRLCQRLRPRGGLVSIYYHPCEWATDAFWDGVNFGRGANPPRAQWQLPPRRTPAQRREGLELFSRYLAHVQSRPEVELLTGRQVLNLLPDRARGRAFGLREIADLARFDEGRVTWRRSGDAVVAPSELFALACGAALVAAGHRDQATHLAPGFLQLSGAGPSLRLCDTPYGPARRAASTVTPGTPLPAAALVAAAADALSFTQAHGRLPDAVWLGSQCLAPADFLATVAQLQDPLAAGVGSGARSPTATPLRSAALDLEGHIPDRPWGWVIFPEGFDAPGLVELARLQTWTLKPALLEGQTPTP
ncbi:MAG: hypothetical protein ABIL09_05800 [Gemmatimonadota bacterium]